MFNPVNKLKNTISNTKDHIKNELKNMKHRLKAIKLVAELKANASLCSMGMGQRGTSISGKVVQIAIGLLIAAIIVPIAIDELVGVSTTDWPAAVETVMTTLLPILGVIGIALILVRRTDLG